MTEHLPVMLEQTLAALDPQPGARFVDGTLGLGGHAEAILERIAPAGTLLGLDRDPEMLTLAEERLARFGNAFRGVRASFSRLPEVVRGSGAEKLDGILLDLGLCSAQLDRPERGFSFGAAARSAPLDMRMDRTHGESATELLSRVELEELAGILRNGEVPHARRVAQALLRRRPLRTVGDVLDALSELALPRRRHHPATLVFQALRMAVNRELRELEAALESGAELLARGGRFAVLSYHSGEDRRVKEFFSREVKGCICPPDLPVCGCGRVPRFRHLLRGARPSAAEVALNPRARSARLRAGERL